MPKSTRKNRNRTPDSFCDDGCLSDLDNKSSMRRSLINDVESSVLRQMKQKSFKNFESLDYEICDNELYQNDRKFRESQSGSRKDFARWIIFIVIGILTALIACFMAIVIDQLSMLKFSTLKAAVDINVKSGSLYAAYLYYALLNAIPVAFASILVTFIEPVAAGGGVVTIKCYLNGIKIPRVVRIKTLCVEIFSVISSLVGSLAGGKEGPMIHAGSVVAAGVSQGKSTTFRYDFDMLRYFRDDHEKRDFVVGGAAAGVSAAFGAPIGGVLLALEETASFYNPLLILRTLVASIISSFTLNLVLSIYHGSNTFAYPGLFHLGKFDDLPYSYFEIPIFMLMGCIGGILGSFWVLLSTKINFYRTRYNKSKWGKVLEAVIIAVLHATLACLMIFTMYDCRPLGVDKTLYPVQMSCKENEYNDVAAFWFTSPEELVKALLHDPPRSHQLLTLLVFVLIYYLLSCITVGLSISLGNFVPTLLLGAAWGRAVSKMLSLSFPQAVFIHPSKYALIGAASQLGGVMRMTISLTTILVETTGNVPFALPLIVALAFAKWVGDFFTESIFDTQITVSKVPMLAWRVKREYRCLKAMHIMSTPPVCIQIQDKVSRIVELLKTSSHNGFPVVDRIDENGTPGHLCGLILRSQLVVIIKNRYFVELEHQWLPNITIETFRNEYPRYPSIDDIAIAPEDLVYSINLKIFMNRSVNSAMESASVSKIFETFRALGLRHFVIVDKKNDVRGVITRKEFL